MIIKSTKRSTKLLYRFGYGCSTLFLNQKVRALSCILTMSLIVFIRTCQIQDVQYIQLVVSCPLRISLISKSKSNMKS